MASAKNLGKGKKSGVGAPIIGVFAPCDPRIDKASRDRAANIVKMVADIVADGVRLPDGRAPEVVYSQVLVDGEAQADVVARQFKDAGVSILVCAPDTWAFPQLTVISLLSHFPADIPLNVTCGNSGPRPGVVYAHALCGALSQMGKLVHLNVGTWPDTGSNPKMTSGTATALVDWCYAAIARQGLKGRRVVVWGHDSMGMETALQHIIPTRNTFGLEITRLDMKLLADMLRKEAYSKKELKAMRGFVDKHLGKRLQVPTKGDSDRFDQGLAMYLIIRDIHADLNAVGGGFMSQLEWGSDRRGLPLPVADAMESFFNASFDHNGSKAPTPYATEADMQGLLTQLAFTWLSGGNPPLFMDFRKVWESWEICALADKLKIGRDGSSLWERRGFVDGDNSGSAAFDWAAKPGASVKEIMKGVSMPLADAGYFPGLGNSVTFVTPAGIEGIAGRMAYSALNNMFTLFWDEACTAELPEKLAVAVANTSNPTWPHTWVVPKYASMVEYKQYAPANHFHMTWNLRPARLQYWMDLTNVISGTPWAARPSFVEGDDRPQPLIHLMNGGEARTKEMLAGRK